MRMCIHVYTYIYIHTCMSVLLFLLFLSVFFKPQPWVIRLRVLPWAPLGDEVCGGPQRFVSLRLRRSGSEAGDVA